MALKKSLLIVGLMLGVLLLAPGTGFAGPPGNAEMWFGLEDVGSGLNNPAAGEFHDASFIAEDTILPGAVAISAGETVDFLVGDGFHQVAIYDAGTLPNDIIPTGTFGGLLVDDSTNRLALGALPFAPAGAKDLTYQFNTPGKYLIICNVLPHFEEARMWGWVNVN